MNAKVIWILFGLAALFAGGVAAGILYHQHAAPLTHNSSHERHHDATVFVDHFRKRLDLNDQQAAKVRDVLDGLHKKIEGLTSDFHDKFTALRSSAWKDIRATLNETQQTEFDKLVEELEKEHSHHH